ncbi:hypothetical protein [Streptomyces sp. HUAS TT7]|uniref:hypothetical protein n=1 Tax=Streptomyces sp. HUAS TT7 TaxID=3447507 RepID=UPI003F659D1D
MLFFQLPRLARTAFLAFIVLPVLLITMLRDCNADAAGYPQGQVTDRDDTQVTVRTGYGEQRTARVKAGDSTHCTPGSSFPACLSH